MKSETTNVASECRTLAELALHRAALGTRNAFRFLTSGEVDGPIEDLRYADLDRRAKTIAAGLQGRGLEGERIVLFYPHSADFLPALFGCAYAGCVVVPVDPTNLRRALPNLARVVSDCHPALILTTRALYEGAIQLARVTAVAVSTPWWTTDGDLPAPDEWRPRRVRPEDLAVLQYTSGSTGDPKGVMLTHGNLMHNQGLIARAIRHDPETCGVSWLPFTHDLGLIGNLIQTVYLGTTCVLISPVAFAQRPSRWLRAISHFRATSSGAPNFGYELAARSIAPQEVAELDLSCWARAYVGAEMIRSQTLERFSHALGPSGFRREAFCPCYGLAEATLIVSGGPTGPATLPLSRAALSSGTIAPANDDADVCRLVTSGPVVGGNASVIVVDPQTRTRCAAMRTGEIWVASGSVARGYWARPHESLDMFGARLADTGEGPYLRTGDEGFLSDGELYVTGRLKDVVIVSARKHHPEDIEATVTRSDSALAALTVAAFGITVDDEEAVVIVVETNRRIGTQADAAAAFTELARTVRRAVTEEHGVRIHRLVFVDPGSLPRTTSGKVRRSECRERFLSGAFERRVRRTSQETQP